jgi:two-component system cell cycle sensor histidine kinase/response regulator CckA
VAALPAPSSPNPLPAVPRLRPVWSGSEAKTREAQTLEVVARLAGGVARDFNEYLTVIAGQAERALELVGPGHPAHAALLEVQASGRAAAEATNDLLAISRRQVLTPQPVDLNSLVRGLVRTLPAMLPAGVHARFELAAMPLVIDVDATQVTRAVTNLVSFMCDAMPTGGIITFGTKTTEIGRARTVRLSIADTGPGLTEDLRARVFEPFVAATSRRKGLALTAAHGIVAQSGGGLSADSVPRGGTVFMLAWPASRHEVQPAAAGRPPITAAS